MATVTLGFDELEYHDLPPVCMVCGSRRDVAFVQRRFTWRPLFAPAGLIMMLTTKRVSGEVPLCPEHGGPRLFATQRFTWWGLKTVAIDADRITLGRVSDDFFDALNLWRCQRSGGQIAEPPPPPRRRPVQVGRGSGGGGTALTALGIIAAVMGGLVVLGVVCVFGLMALGVLVLPRAGAPAAPPPPTAGPPAAVPNGPGPIVDAAGLDKALADLRVQDPFTVAAAAKRLAQTAPDPVRRQETAEALLLAMNSPFPMAKQAAAEALAVWGSADETPALVRMLADQNPNVRSAAITALAGLKDDRAAAAVAGRLSDFFDREKARKALTAMGPVGEKALIPLVNAGDAPTRVEACGILKAIGTPASLPELERAVRDPDMNVARAAAEAVKAVWDRQNHAEKRP